MPRKAATTVAEPDEAEESDNVALTRDIVRLRDDEEKNWSEIAEELEISQGRTILLYLKATLRPEDVVKWTDDDDLGKKIVKMRDDDQISWGVIGVRCQVPESKVRRLYLDTTGISSVGLRIGKGGRYPADENGANGAATPRVSKAASKKAAAGEASSAGAVDLPNPKEVPFSQWTLPQLKTRFNGKSVAFVGSSGKQERKTVKNVLKIADGEMTFTDSDGARRTIVTTAIKSVGR